MSKLFRKILFLFIILFGLVANATSIYSGWVLYHELTRQYRSKAISIVKSIASSSAEIFMTRDTATIQAVIDQYVEIEGVFYIAVDDRGGEIIAHTFAPQVPQAVKNTLASVQRVPSGGSGSDRESVQVLESEGFLNVSAAILGGLAGYVHVGMDTHKISGLIWSTIIRTQLITFLVFLGSIGISYLLIRSISRPIGQLREYARNVANHDFSARLDIDAKDEIGDLADSMRSMSSELNSFIAELEAAVSKATGELQDTLSFQSAIVDNLADGLAVIDTNGNLLRCNQALLNMFGYTLPELVGRHWENLFDANIHPYIGSLVASHQNISRSPAGPFEGAIGSDDPNKAILGRRKDQSRFPLEISLTCALMQDQWHGIAIIRDVTVRHQMHKTIKEAQASLERRVEERTAALVQTNKQLEREISERLRVEDRLAAEKELLTVTMRSIAEGVVTTDLDGRIVIMNRAAENILDLSQVEACGQKFSAVFDRIETKQKGPRVNPVDQVLTTGRIFDSGPDLILKTRQEGERHVIHSAAPIMDRKQQLVGAVMVFRDQTERIKLQEQILKADKLESVGLLAGGIAHDFNNILSAVMGNIELAQFEAEETSELQELLTNALRAGRRAQDLTQQLLTFSKGGAPVKQTTSVVDLIKDSALFALRGSNIQCEFEMPDSLWAVEIDAGQISQVINNLVINAMQAMPEGGTVRVTAENETLGGQDATFLSPGRYVKVSISDQGPGIAERLRHKIIDPYFSTKAGGSGLGLAVAYSVIRQHGGHIDFDTRPDEGSTFYFFLKASDNAATSSHPKELDAAAGEGKLLIMDDEEMILKVASSMLTRLGYSVSCAHTGQEAIRMYRQALEAGQPFNAVIMDLTIPGQMGGKEAIQELKAFDPDVKAIVSSGYSNDPVMADYQTHGFCGIVSKPYRLNELGRAIQEVLGHRSGASMSPP